MENDKLLLLKKYLSNIQVDLVVANYIHCPLNWRDIDYIPDLNKFYYICDGEGWLKIGNKEFFPKPGQLFLMPAGIKQSYSQISNNTFTKYWCHFTATIGNTNLFDVIQLPYFINVKNSNKLEYLFKKLIKNYESHEITASLKIKSTLFEIITYYIENSYIEDIKICHSSLTEKLNLVIKYIDKHLSEKISVSELADIVYLHPNYFIKIFKLQLGISPIKYINKQRMEKGKSLLTSTDISITEIADITGYSNVYHFSSAFKKFTGFSPSQYRQAISFAKNESSEI